MDTLAIAFDIDPTASHAFIVYENNMIDKISMNSMESSKRVYLPTSDIKSIRARQDLTLFLTLFSGEVLTVIQDDQNEDYIIVTEIMEPKEDLIF